MTFDHWNQKQLERYEACLADVRESWGYQTHNPLEVGIASYLECRIDRLRDLMNRKPNERLWQKPMPKPATKGNK